MIWGKEGFSKGWEWVWESGQNQSSISRIYFKRLMESDNSNWRNL